MKQLLLYTAGVSAVILTACSLLQTSLAPKAASIINAYCLEPQAARLVLREQVATQIAPNRVEIHCKGDQ